MSAGRRAFLACFFSFAAFTAVAGCRGILGIDDHSGASADGGAEDATTGDAGADSGPRFCPSAIPDGGALLCDDFDDDDPIETGWDNTKLSSTDLGIAGKATITADTVSYSRPRSVSLDVSPLASNTENAGAFLIKYLPTTPVSLVVQAEILIATENFPAGQNGHASLLSVSFLPGGEIDVVRMATGTEMWISSGPAAAPVIARYPFKTVDFVVGQWSELVVAMDNEPTNGQPYGAIAVMLNGLPATDGQLPASFQVTGSQELDFGPFANGPMDELRVNIDDVLLF